MLRNQINAIRWILLYGYCDKTKKKKTTASNHFSTMLLAVIFNDSYPKCKENWH